MTADRRTRLLLLRHADAVEPATWSGSDASRPLSAEGRSQADRLGRHLALAGVEPELILSSSRLRAEETARIVGDHVRRPVAIEERLSSGFGLADLEEMLADAGRPARPLLVGHDPHLSDVASELTDAELALGKATLVAIDLAGTAARGAGRLRWLLPAEVVPGR